ncbi:MAG: tyrosine-protein phosphatase [Candidatus Binatia bacterium]
MPRDLSPLARAEYRHLPVQGAPNFRDLGGYRSSDGRTVKWGMLYRSDALDKLTDEDQRYLDRLGLARVVDFRSAGEVKDAPDKLPPDLAPRLVKLPIEAVGVNVRELVQRINSGRVEGLNVNELLFNGNAALARDHAAVYKTWLHGLVEPGGAPEVFHCTGGKDRTGFASALVLLALGVPKDVVMQDYLASNTYLADKNRAIEWRVRLFSFFRTDPAYLRPLLNVEPRYLNAAFDVMEKNYGSIDNYLREALGADEPFRAALRERFLEPQAGS